ncbi:MAG: NAD(P)-dependent dehydrogenase (short-subunit alcohol dehydrogenase family) [Candidatus Poriferisodalaceae bacterium]|jgi:NAD(P)-dependent dehydrogenase (short-subunit alcohol dehydrogenase family)
MLQDYEGTTAVITGGAGGIGLGLAHRLGQAGANLVIADIEEEALERSVDQLRAAGADVLGVRTDVGKAEEITALADAAQERFGDIHLLHNNAGVCTTGLAEEQSEAQWDWVIDVNLRSVVWGCREFLPRMKAHGQPAHIINTASMAGMNGGPFMAPYFATKFAVVGLSESLWHEAQTENSNVGISVLCPGFVRTGIARSDRNEPDGLGGWVAEGSQGGAQFAELLSAGVDAGIEPAEVAEIIVDAVAEGRLWILTHPGSAESIAARADAIGAGGVPPGPRIMTGTHD